MRKGVMALVALIVSGVGICGGQAWAGGEDWNACLTPSMMARIESVLTMDGKASDEQFNARVLAFEWWLAGGIEKLNGNRA